MSNFFFPDFSDCSLLRCKISQLGFFYVFSLPCVFCIAFHINSRVYKNCLYSSLIPVVDSVPGESREQFRVPTLNWVTDERSCALGRADAHSD